MTPKEKRDALEEIGNNVMMELIELQKLKLEKKAMAICVMAFNADTADKIRRVISEQTDNTGGVVVSVQGKQLPAETIEQIQKATKEAAERAKNGLGYNLKGLQ